MFNKGDEKITWLASYPKSGNTWVRCLLQAYRNNGELDVNDLNMVVGDSAACYTRAVSPLPLDQLGKRGAWLVRPAHLLMAMLSKPQPRIFKTHYANVEIAGLPPFIPTEFTERAIYVVRDPRSVVLSMSKFYGLSTLQAVDSMQNIQFEISRENEDQIPQKLSSWSNHVASWTQITSFPVHVVRYEDLCEDPLSELKDILEFMGVEYIEARAKRAVKAAELSKMQKKEKAEGFAEYRAEIARKRGTFFGEGGTRWQYELGPKWIKLIERDHGEVMKAMKYELSR